MTTTKIRNAMVAWMNACGTPQQNSAADALMAELQALDAATPPTFLAVYIAAPNDRNGNPRRGWYVSRLDGEPVIASVPTGRKGETAPAYTCWVDEGYDGFGAIQRAIAAALSMPLPSDVRQDREHIRSLVHETGRIDVTPGEYRSARKLPRFGGAA